MGEIEQKIQTALEQIRPSLQADGGDIELIGVEGGTVRVRLHGACSGCPSSQMTLTMGVEEHLKREVPGVERVVTG